MTLLVTGAGGHVAWHVACRAADAGVPVLATFRGAAPPPERERPGLTWVACELADAEAVARLAGAHAIEACLHAAAISNEAYARPDPLAAVHANVGATANLLDAARRHGWRRLVLVSTGSVFQALRDPMRPIPEDAPPSPVNVYGTTKFCAEQLVATYRSQFHVSAAAVRISWVYGPPVVGTSPTRGPIPYLLGRVLRGEAVREATGADFAASFTHVGDVAAGLLAAVSAPVLAHGVYHLGPGVNFSLGAVADAIRAAVPGAVIELGPGQEPWTTYTAPRGPLVGDRLAHDTGFAIAPTLVPGIDAYAQWMRADPAASP